MSKDFQVIDITSPLFIKDEAEKINKILRDGSADLVHIRKPGSNEKEVEKLIQGISPIFYPRLKLHDHFELLEKYPLGGIHLNLRNNRAKPNVSSISISFHSLDEIKKSGNYDYFFISPIFDSISKAGYKGKFDFTELSNVIRGKKAIALGGITPDKFNFLKSMGFSGAAMLGYFFPSTIK